MEKMYKEEEPVVVPDKTTVSLPATNTKEEKTIAPDNKDALATTSKKSVKKIKPPVREIKFSDFSRGRIIPKMVVIQEIKATSPVIDKEENN